MRGVPFWLRLSWHLNWKRVKRGKVYLVSVWFSSTFRVSWIRRGPCIMKDTLLISAEFFNCNTVTLPNRNWLYFCLAILWQSWNVDYFLPIKYLACYQVSCNFDTCSWLLKLHNKPWSLTLWHIPRFCIFTKIFLFKILQARCSEVNDTPSKSFSKGVGSLLKSHYEKQ